MSGIHRDLTYELNRLAVTLDANGNPKLAATGAANVWAGTNGLAMLGALNVKAGVTNPKDMHGLAKVCNVLASTTNLDPVSALRTIP